MAASSLFRVSEGWPPGCARLAGFIALSVVLHVVTVIGTGPLDLSAGRPGPAPQQTELYATLVTGESARPVPAPVPSAEPPSAGKDAAVPPSGPTERARAETDGIERGLVLPAPDKWYTASEVDVRAEPITDIRLRYPAHVTGGVVGKVRVRVFIDEGGVVRKLQIAESEPAGVFDEAAKQGWQDVRFSPARRNGVAVKSQKLLELNFTPTGGL